MKALIYILLSVGFFVSTANAQSVKRTKKGKYKKTTVVSKNGKHKKTVVRKNGKVVATKTTHKRRPHTKYKHLPKRGAVVIKRPRGARVIKHNKRKYWLNNGVYYTKSSNGYRVVRPRRGLRVKILPVGYRKVIVKNRPYYYYYGTYYAQPVGSNEYEVVDAPVEAQVTALPEGYETVIEDGETYYVLDGTYYKEVPLDETGENWGYEVVKVTEIPEDEI
jgi:hypothetical protein